ncbi:hypothetical protein K491DRAFT_395337 [Lophiostoma macrostomum CBS 122681]|uniref:Uncharacterized protein n=1 Tax=Lophiostoma macrostomum CBS 122681 TaxID=1314788 RepID=A0A6A6T8J5_9PLEO|nr:hypothetical protein K491DRAFT_395337 [Lophiostoma macrostomum CBS 122681]
MCSSERVTHLNIPFLYKLAPSTSSSHSFILVLSLPSHIPHLYISKSLSANSRKPQVIHRRYPRNSPARRSKVGRKSSASCGEPKMHIFPIFGVPGYESESIKIPEQATIANSTNVNFHPRPRFAYLDGNIQLATSAFFSQVSPAASTTTSMAPTYFHVRTNQELLELLKDQLQQRQKVSMSQIPTDKDLARMIQDLGFGGAFTHATRLASTTCVGTWKDLPWEIKSAILEPILKVNFPITFENVDAVVATNLKFFRKVSRSFRHESEQMFYQYNLIVIQPMTPITDQPLRLRYPTQRVNHYIKQIEFRGVQSFFREHHDDAWQFLKNVTLGKYGFQKLEKVTVYFEPSIFKMQTFWGWDIEVEVEEGRVSVNPDDKDWEARLHAALKARASARSYGRHDHQDVGFKLIRTKGSSN